MLQVRDGMEKKKEEITTVDRCLGEVLTIIDSEKEFFISISLMFFFFFKVFIKILLRYGIYLFSIENV